MERFPTCDQVLNSIGERIRSERLSRGWSARKLAARSGVSERFVFLIEKGQANASIKKLMLLGGELGLPLDLLLRPPEWSSSHEQFFSSLAEASPEMLLHLSKMVEEERRKRLGMISLLGLRGAGKSTVGELLAKKLACQFVELDRCVEERAEMKLSELFSFHGPEFYVSLERECLDELLNSGSPCVIATGGGVVSHGESWDILRSHTTSIWLRAQPEIHWQRVVEQGDQRPMSGRPRAFEQLCSILQSREPHYALADFVLDTDQATPAELATEIAARLGARDAV